MAKPRRVKLRREGDAYVLLLGNQEMQRMCLDWEKVTDYRLSPGEEIQIELHIKELGKKRRTKAPKPPEVPSPVRMSEMEAIRQRDRLNHGYEQIQFYSRAIVPPTPNNDPELRAQMERAVQDRVRRQQEEMLEEAARPSYIEGVPNAVVEELHREAIHRMIINPQMSVAEFAAAHPLDIFQEYRHRSQRQREVDYRQRMAPDWRGPRRSRF